MVKVHESAKLKNLLYLTGMFPYDQNLMSGIFVARRVEYILSHTDINLEAVALVTKHNSLLTKVIRLLPDITICKASNNFSYFNYIFYKLKPLDYFIKMFNKGDSYKKISFGFYNLLKDRYDFYRFDLIHAHFVQLAGFIANRIFEEYKIPYVITIHGSDIHTNPFKDISTMTQTIKALEEAAVAIFVSNYLLDTAKRLGYSGNNAVVISNGINTEIFRPLKRDICRKKLSKYKQNNFVIGYVGSLKQIKGAHFLPEIFRHIKNLLHNVQFLVVGDGELRDYIYRKCQKNKIDVIFTGIVPQEELAILYNSMDVLIVPSLKEGLSCVILEAQACGIPSVGSNIGGIPEAIGGKEFGKIVDLGEDFEKRFADGVIEVIKNRPSVTGLRKRALDFSWNKTLRKEIELYYEIMKK